MNPQWFTKCTLNLAFLYIKLHKRRATKFSKIAHINLNQNSKIYASYYKNIKQNFKEVLYCIWLSLLGVTNVRIE